MWWWRWTHIVARDCKAESIKAGKPLKTNGTYEWLGMDEPKTIKQPPKTIKQPNRKTYRAKYTLLQTGFWMDSKGSFQKLPAPFTMHQNDPPASSKILKCAICERSFNMRRNIGRKSEAAIPFVTLPVHARRVLN